jgi:DNA-binding MarR family transcriptional regulator
MSNLQDRCARELMDTAPQIMQAIRVEMRLGRGADISIPQFRALRFIQRNPDSSLSNLAENLGLMLPSVSKLVDGLVKAGLVIRQESTADRRRLTLDLTAAGESLVDASREKAQANLAASLEGLCDEELDVIHRAMQLLHSIFASPADDKEIADWR